MIKCVMIQLCKCLAGVSLLALHLRFCYLLLGWIGTLVVVGVQLAIAGWMVWAMIRAPHSTTVQHQSTHVSLVRMIHVSLKTKNR